MKVDETIPKVRPNLKDFDLSKGGVVENSIVSDNKIEGKKTNKTQYIVLGVAGAFLIGVIIYKLSKNKQ